MIRRHPHVFGDKRARDAAEVLRNWEQLKAEERNKKAAGKQPRPASLLDGVSRGLPATLEGFQLTRRAARIGFDWENVQGVLDKVREETAELERLLADEGQGTSRSRPSAARPELSLREEELGDLLFAVVNLARFLQIDPEIALKRANRKFSRRFRGMEQRAAAQGTELADVPRERMEALWDEMKRGEPEKAVPAARAHSGATTP